MNSLVALVLLGQIIGCTLSHHFTPDFDCNGEEAEKLAHQAVDYINKHNLHGYKQTLNIIEGAVKLSRRPHGEVIFLEIKVLETVCHVLDPTPLENCTVRPQHYHAVEGDCDVKILSDASASEVLFVKCHSDPDSVEDVLRHCPSCPILLPLNDHRVEECVDYVLHKHNEKLPNHAYAVLEISRGQHKHDPEAFYVEFAIVETNCTHQEVHDGHHHCHPKPLGEAHIGFCRATVFRPDDAPEKPKDENYESDCVIFDVKEGTPHTHLINHHFGKQVISAAHNNTVLDLAHSHNHTGASHESHSHEHPVAVPLAKRTSPPGPPRAIPLCPGKIHHFKV
ncbi:antihemorrhagic factor cHLP-B-like [Erythrolamprus reginae]|uniref:antihemorrhagic factor cHLP-B-like n=1 Tax=Erythrolamprus reginae TaxID=121349 RepID=UPI00396CB6EF